MDISGPEPDALAGLSRRFDQPAGGSAGPVDYFAEHAAEHGERAGGSAVVVQLGALVRQPAEQPDVDAGVTVDALVPATLRVVGDERIALSA